MKKLYTVLCVALLAVTAQAQINKGQVLAGGTISFESTKRGDNYKSTDLTFAPNLGYFFINNLAGGLRIHLNSSTSEVGIVEVESSSTAVAPFLRYYFLPAGRTINVFADAAYGAGNNKVEEEKQSFNYYSLSAGPAVFLTSNVALEATLGYNSSKAEDDRDRTNTFGINLGFQIHLGK
mgnify:FL=1